MGLHSSTYTAMIVFRETPALRAKDVCVILFSSLYCFTRAERSSVTDTGRMLFLFAHSLGVIPTMIFPDEVDPIFFIVPPIFLLPFPSTSEEKSWAINMPFRGGNPIRSSTPRAIPRAVLGFHACDLESRQFQTEKRKVHRIMCRCTCFFAVLQPGQGLDGKVSFPLDQPAKSRFIAHRKCTDFSALDDGDDPDGLRKRPLGEFVKLYPEGERIERQGSFRSFYSGNRG